MKIMIYDQDLVPFEKNSTAMHGSSVRFMSWYVLKKSATKG
jgi:hypothetical protein